METCRVCGETKAREYFYRVVHFTKFQKHKVIWCRDCQKMFMDKKKTEIKRETLETWKPSGEVSFN